MHIAQSVVNRILNARDEIDTDAEMATLPEPSAAPEPVDPTIEGAQLDVSLQQPTPAVSAPSADEATTLLQQGLLSDVAG